MNRNAAICAASAIKTGAIKMGILPEVLKTVADNLARGVDGYCLNYSELVQELADDNGGKLPGFTSLGGYPIFYFDEQNNIICPKCAREEATEFDPMVCGYDVNYESPDLYCDNCSTRIESAYADEENDN